MSAKFKFQAKIPICSGVSRESDKNKPVPLTPRSKDERLNDIGHSMSIGNLVLVVSSVSYLIHYDSLLQNATDIFTKCDNYFITKWDWILSQNTSGFLLQNAIVLLQNARVISNCDNFITKCDIYYKMRRLLQIATAQK